MPAWWNSLEAVNALTWYLRWIGAGLTIIGGVCVIATLATSKRAETLREARQADRRLSAFQRKQILDLLAGQPGGQVEVACPTMSLEPCKYARELADVLKEAGWEVTLNDRIVIIGAAETDLKVIMHNDVDLEPGVLVTRDGPVRARSLYNALRLAYLPVEVQFSSSVSEGNVRLLVGFKP